MPRRLSRFALAAACAAALALAGLALAADGTDPAGDASPADEDIVSFSITRANPLQFDAVVGFKEDGGKNVNLVQVIYGVANGADCNQKVVLFAGRRAFSGAVLRYESSDSNGTAVLSDGGKTLTLSANAASNQAKAAIAETKMDCARITMSYFETAGTADTTSVVMLPDVVNPTPTPTASATVVATVTPAPTATAAPGNPACDRAVAARDRARKKLSRIKAAGAPPTRIRKVRAKLAAKRATAKRACA